MQIIFNDTGKIRIDKWLAYKLPEKSREFFNKNIRLGKILLNDKIIKSSEKLNIRDKIDILDEILEENKIEIIPNKKIKLKVIFENDDFIIIDKPAGLLVHPVTIDDNETLVNALVYKWPEIKEVGEDPLRPGIVHRLDRDTSGLMIIAKNQKIFNSLKLKFQKHLIQKIYLALVFGKLKEKKGIINMPITRSESKFNRRKVCFGEDKGKEAITQYEVIQEFKNLSLIKAYPKTGRTHQIRVHLASISNFVIGDNEYGSKKINKKYDVNRQFLHSSELIFDLKKHKYHFKSELPLELRKILKRIQLVD